MKSYPTISKVIWMLCAAFIVSLTACSSDDDNDTLPSKPKEEVLKFIQTRLYDKDGNVAANRLKEYAPGEYNLIADYEDEVREYFTEMTGIEAPLQATYKYVYQSTDGKCTISIDGRREPEKGLFATIRFTVPEYPKINILHIGTEAILEGTNDAGSDMSETDLPHRVKGNN